MNHRRSLNKANSYQVQTLTSVFIVNSIFDRHNSSLPTPALPCHPPGQHIAELTPAGKGVAKL
ncbi:hypothetical protein E2C01_034087 [Portunus trituberculatus]|uniref:Uncharacterized protein n=1 Tax=Portunus trituberculatus TaxID=210409 RepID=A0A5B7F568_PORTR|nr:hypothetical protein [Portunus trituberculatus]